MLDPKKLPRTAHGRILWSQVPGFREWLLKTAPSLTQPELIDAIHERCGVQLIRSAAQGLRQQFNVPMNAETKRRAYEQRTEHNPVKPKPPKPPKPEEPQLSPEEKLERDLARREIARLTGRQTFFEMLGQKIIGAVANLPAMPVLRSPSIQVSKGLGEEEMVLLISDVQAGLKVDAHESGGLGSFGSEILLDQIAYLLKSIASIRKYHPNVRRLHVFWLGDIVENETIYGGQLREIDANVIQQVLLCWEHFGAFQAQLAGMFESVHCRGVVGNHGRIGRKGEHSPMSNFDYLLYRMWEERLKPVKNLTWKVSESWWDIAQVMGWKWLLVHGDDSVTGDVPVMIRRGGRFIDIAPIASLYRSDKASGWYRGTSRLEVLSGSGWTRLLGVYRHLVKKELFDVVTSDGRTKVTDDHSLIAGGEERKPQTLIPGTVIDTVRPVESDGGAYDTMGDEVAWACGLFAAEGSLTCHIDDAGYRSWHARVANTDLDLLERARHAFEGLFGQPCSIHRAGEPPHPRRRPCHQLRLGRAACGFVRTWMYGDGPDGVRYKKVPIQILNASPKVMRSFLDGYLAGDGCFDTHSGHWKADTKDLSLAAGIQFLLERLGAITSIGVRQDKKTITTVKHVRALAGRVSGEVKQVRSLGMFDGAVYDLETESHTFVAGAGYLVHHNSGMGWAGIPFYAVVRHKARYRELFKQLREEFGDFDFMAAGHHSVIAHFNAIWLNGSWPGGTEFSLKRLQLGDVPAQWLMGVHKERGVTWARPIHLRPLKVEKTA